MSLKNTMILWFSINSNNKMHFTIQNRITILTLFCLLFFIISVNVIMAQVMPPPPSDEAVMPPPPVSMNDTPSATTGNSQSAITDWQIETGIPISGLTKGTPIKDPGVYFNKLYTFAVSAVMVVAIITVIYAGLLWMTSPYLVQKKEAMDRMTGVALGILLLLSTNLILKTINPNLVNWDLSKLTSVGGLNDSITGIMTEGTAGEGGGGGNNNNYTPSGEGACSTDSLGKYFRDTKELATAMCVCTNESSGNPKSLNKSCLQGGDDFSVGGMQYNLWTCGRCPGAWENCLEDTPQGAICIVKNASALKACAANVGVNLESSGNSFNIIGIDWDRYLQGAVVPLQSSLSGWGNWSTYAGGCDTGWTRYKNDAEDYLINKNE